MSDHDAQAVERARVKAHDDRQIGLHYSPAWYSQDYFRHEHYLNRPWSAQVAWQLRRHLKPRDVLDVGAGTGLLVEAFTLQGIETHGVELSQHAIDRAHPLVRDRLHQHDVTRQRLPFPDASFDLVTSVEVFEHLPDHQLVLSEIRRVLRPGGRFFLQTPKPGTAEADDPTHIHARAKPYWRHLARPHGLEADDAALMRFEHELPMTQVGQRLGWLRTTRVLRSYVIRTGTRSLFRTT